MKNKNNVNFKCLSLIFALCCVFIASLISFKGVYVKATTNEISENDTTEEIIEEENQEETTEEDVNELVEDLSLEIKDFIIMVFGALSALGISWGSIATVTKWLKNKVKDANQDLSKTFEMMKEIKQELEETKKELRESKEQNEKTNIELSNVKLLLNDFYDATKLKQSAIEKAVNQALTNDEKKEDDLKDESI